MTVLPKNLKTLSETVHGRQFDWGGRLLKSTGGVHKVNLLRHNHRSFKYNNTCLLDCKIYKSNRDESRL